MGALSCLSILSVTLMYCGQMVGWIKMPLATEVGLGLGNIVRWAPSSSPRNGAQQSPDFLSHVYCGQTDGWIRIPLGTEVERGAGYIVLDADTAALNFSAHVHCGQTVAYVRCQQLLRSCYMILIEIVKKKSILGYFYSHFDYLITENQCMQWVIVPDRGTCSGH